MKALPFRKAALVALNAALITTVHAATLQWDAAPATPGLQDGAGNWSSLSSLTDWWDGAQNVAWIPGATAVIGTNLTAAATITITNPIVVGGIIFSNIPVSGTAAYTIAAAAGGTLTLTGNPATVLSAVNYPASPTGGSANETISAPLIATGGLQVLSATPWVAQIGFNNVTNFIAGTLEIGTPGNASYTTPTAMQAQFNSSGIGAGALSGCNTLIIHSNASLLLRGGSGGFTLSWPKKFILSGDGIPNSFFCFAALSFSGNNGSLFPAEIELAGDTTIAGVWGVNSVILTNSGSISGTGRLRLCSSANRSTSGTLILKGKHTYAGDTIFDGTITVQLASGQDDRLPMGTCLKLGTSGAFYAANNLGVPQSGWNGYGRLVLGDTAGPMNQTLAGLTNDPTLNTSCWVVGGNTSTNSFLTINNATDWTYNARLGGSTAPSSKLGLIKSGPGTLYLQGTNQCAGGYTVNAGTLVIGDGVSDYPLSGPLTNNAALTLNTAASLTYSDFITGTGTLTKAGYGTLTLTGTNTSTGPSRVQAGKLVFSPTSTGAGAIQVAPGAELQLNRAVTAAGLPAASLLLDNAALDLDLNLALAAPGAAAPLNVIGALTNSGYAIINVLRPGPLSLGRFPLVHYGTYRSNDFSSFTLSALAPGIAASVEDNPVTHTLELNITALPSLAATATGAAALTLTWPPACAGWQLQMQTNPLSLGLSTNWFPVFGSTASNQLTFPLDPAAGTAFFRIAYPAADQPIFTNAAFRFFPARMEAADLYQGIYRSSNGQTITKDGDPTYTWTDAHLDLLYLQTPYPILDAAFALAVDSALGMRAPAGTTSAQLSGDQPGGQYYFPYFYFSHGTDIREYTRDSAQHIQWGDSVILDPVTTRGTLIRRCDFSKNLIREDAVTTADSVHFISAAWEYFKITGDTNFLLTCWSCLTNTITTKELAQKDPADGLWTGSPWSDSSTGFITQQEFDTRQTAVKSLYGNLMVTGAWRDLALIAALLGRTNEAAQYSQKSAASKAAINAQLYRPEFGTYCYYKYQPSSTYYNYREDISAGLLYLFDVADAPRCLDYHARFTPTLYGYRNVDPILPAGATAYHGGNVWENQEAFHGWALARLGQPDQLEPFIFWHARAGLPLKKWQEGTIDPSTGQLHVNYTRVVWGAMGYASYWSRGVFGLLYDPASFSFAPCVPRSFGNGFYAVLNNFNYRNARLRLILTGCGTNLDQTLLDGVPVTSIPASLSGLHTVQVKMTGALQPQIPSPPR